MSLSWKSVVDPFVMLICSEKKVIITDKDDPYGHILVYQIRGIDTCMSSLNKSTMLCNTNTLEKILNADQYLQVDADRLEKTLFKLGYEDDREVDSSMVGNARTQTLFIKCVTADDYVKEIDELISALKTILHDSSKILIPNAQEFFEHVEVKKFKDF